ncbi:MAG: hypothetical protein JWR26_4842 [Pedosphaera sp.]|nr:hypothetical protein [Pedosphaera sp.]
MKKLKELLKQVEFLAEEFGRLEKIEREARSQVSAAMESGDVNDDKYVAKLSLATSRLALVPKHRQRLENQGTEAARNLRPVLNAAKGQWNVFVCSKADAEFKRFIAIAAPFFGGVRNAQNRFESIPIPSVHELQSHSWNSHIPSDDFEMLRKDAEAFLAMIAREGKKLGWSEPE